MAEERSVAIDELAPTQHGLVTTEQAVGALGLTRKNRWVREGRLVSVQPRVLRVAGARETWHQQLRAAQLASGGVVSHRSAAELWGLIQPAGYIEVSTTPDQHPRLRAPAVVHSVADLQPERAVDREGLLLTDPVRTVVDLAVVLPHWAVGVAVSRGLSTRLFGPHGAVVLRDALGRPGRPGAGSVRRLAEHRSLGTAPGDELLEARLTALVDAHGLPTPSFQHEIWHGGRFVARVDAAFVTARLGVEVDGCAPRADTDQVQRDRARRARVESVGWSLHRLPWRDVVDHPQSVASDIREALVRVSAA